jgi:hypothetical protein
MPYSPVDYAFASIADSLDRNYAYQFFVWMMGNQSSPKPTYHGSGDAQHIAAIEQMIRDAWDKQPKG